MEFFSGLVLGWLSSPYVLVLGAGFLSMFPVLFFGIDIYEEREIRYRIWQTVLLMGLTLTALHFLTPFDVNWLITNDFWESVRNSLVWILAYFLTGTAYAYLRWVYYVRAYYKRHLGKNPSEEDIKRAYKHRLSAYGSRFSLIMKWIMYWPWSAIAWALTDLVREIVDFLWGRIRAFFGARFGAIARAFEPKEFRKMKEEEEKKAAGKAVTDQNKQ